MADLVSGRYAQSSAIWAMLGQLSNATNSDVPARSNLEFPLGDVASASLVSSGVIAAVPVPVDQGTVISNVIIIVNGAASTPTHSFAALYSGTNVAAPPLMAQSTDGTTAAIAASGVFQFTLATPQLINATNCPNGFVYAAVSVTGTATPTVATLSVPTAIGYQWFTSSTTPKGNSPLGFSLTSGSTVGGTATATLASPSAAATAPVVILT